MSSSRLASPHGGSRDLTLADGASGEPAEGELGRGTELGHYVILERIGAGGMGVVYAAYDRDLDRRVAIKLLRSRVARPKDQARLLREAQAMARLAHPNVVAVHEVGIVAEQSFVAMEFIDGQTFDRWRSAEARPWRDVVAIMVQAARGLAAAHDQGLVHRDFKPENVLVGKDGRTRVADFGLAQAVGEATQEEILLGESAGGSSRVAARLTETGGLAGTPAYMAPEQFRGGKPSARSDQFSFCVSLWEGLYGERPFEGSSRKELALAACAGKIREPSNREVPAFLKRALRRGLSVSPDDRFPNMNALVAAIDRDPGSRRRRLLLTVAAAAGIATLSAAAARWSEAPPDPCDGADDRIAEVWNGSHEDKLAAAFGQVDAEFAVASLATVTDELDDYAQRWSEAYREACEATHVRHEQSTELLDHRMACLGQRIAAMEATIGVLEEADREAITNSIRVATALPAVSECSRTDHMMARFAPPKDPAVAAEVNSARLQIEQAHLLGLTGKAEQGLALAEGARAHAADLGFPPLKAEAALAVATLSVTVGQPHEALELLHDALNAAVESGHDEVLVDATVRLITVVGVSLSRYEEGQRWARLAEAAVVRRGQEPSDVVNLRRSMCFMLADKGDHKGALSQCREALELSIQHYGTNAAQTGLAYRALGNAYHAASDFEAAKIAYDQATALFLKSHGVDHPEYPVLLNASAITCHSLGHGAQCVPLFEKTVAASIASYGPDHPAVADLTNNLAEVLLDNGRLDDAEVRARRSLHIRKVKFGDAHPGIAAAHQVLAEIERARGAQPQAKRHAEVAVSVYRRTRGAEHPDVMAALRTRAQINLDGDAVAEGLEDWDAAVRMADRIQRPAKERAEYEFGFAKALHAHRPAEAARALSLARRARGDAEGSLKTEISEWIAAHSP